MAQSDFGTIVASTKSGSQLAIDLNNWRDAVHSSHKGSSRPSYAVAGTLWVNDAGTPWVLYCYDGADDISLGTVNASTNVFTPSGITTSFSDSDFELKDNSDSSKKVKFELSSVSAATTRTITLPDANFTPAIAGSVGSSGLTQSTSKILGRSTAGTGSVEEISVGANLTLSGGTLSATVGTWVEDTVSFVSNTGFYPVSTLPVGVTEIEMYFLSLSTNGTSPIILRLVDEDLTLSLVGYNGTTTNMDTGVATTSYTNAIALTQSAVATGTYTGKVSLVRPDSSGTRWFATSSLSQTSAASNFIANSSVALSPSKNLYGVQLTTLGGVNLFDGGTIWVRYR